MCNLKRVTLSNELTKNYHLQFPSGLQAPFNVFQLIVLILRPATLTFQLTNTSIINLVSSHIKQLFSALKKEKRKEKSCDKPATHYLPSIKRQLVTRWLTQELLAAKEENTSLRSRWSYKEEVAEN